MALQSTARLVGHEARVWQVDWHPAGLVLASCSEDKTLRLWKVVEGEWSCFVRTTTDHASRETHEIHQVCGLVEVRPVPRLCQL